MGLLWPFTYTRNKKDIPNATSSILEKKTISSFLKKVDLFKVSRDLLNYQDKYSSEFEK